MDLWQNKLSSKGVGSPLANGLAILRLLAEAGGALSSTEIARRVGLDQSQASRILKTLIAAGFVRKPDYRSFTLDYGFLALGNSAFRFFPIGVRPIAAMRETARRGRGLDVWLATLWDSHIIHFLHAARGAEPTWSAQPVGGNPLHLSSIALRLLLERPRAEALAALRASQARDGWARPSPAVPRNPEECLRRARELLHDDCLLLKDWQGKGLLTAAIPIANPGGPLAALALSGPAALVPADAVRKMLREGRDRIAAALQARAARPNGPGAAGTGSRRTTLEQAGKQRERK